jgi:hypothetical protein
LNEDDKISNQLITNIKMYDKLIIYLEHTEKINMKNEDEINEKHEIINNLNNEVIKLNQINNNELTNKLDDISKINEEFFY